MYRLYQSLLGLNCCSWGCGLSDRSLAASRTNGPIAIADKKPATFDYSFLFAPMSTVQMSVVYK